MTRDEIYKKAQNVNGFGGMTINERLWSTGLIDVFDTAKSNNKEYARILLEAIRVDKLSIDKILE